MNKQATLSPLEALRQVLASLVSRQMRDLNYLLGPNACLKIGSGHNQMQYISRATVCEALLERANSWPNPIFFDVQDWHNTPTAASVQFEIWDRPNGRLLCPFYSVSLTLCENKIESLELSQKVRENELLLNGAMAAQVVYSA
jgi:hypothetical protein